MRLGFQRFPSTALYGIEGCLGLRWGRALTSKCKDSRECVLTDPSPQPSETTTRKCLSKFRHFITSQRWWMRRQSVEWTLQTHWCHGYHVFKAPCWFWSAWPEITVSVCKRMANEFEGENLEMKDLFVFDEALYSSPGLLFKATIKNPHPYPT